MELCDFRARPIAAARRVRPERNNGGVDQQRRSREQALRTADVLRCAGQGRIQ